MNFIIDYIVLDNQGITLKEGKIRVKNKLSECQAKVHLEVYLKRRYAYFERLIITNCVEVNPVTELFNDVFK